MVKYSAGCKEIHFLWLQLEEGKKQSRFSSFQDPVLSDGRVIIDVVDCLKPGCINFNVVKDGHTDEVSA